MNCFLQLNKKDSKGQQQSGNNLTMINNVLNIFITLHQNQTHSMVYSCCYYIHSVCECVRVWVCGSHNACVRA